MLLKKILYNIPFLECLFYFPRGSHGKALVKFLVLLIASSLPILAAAVLTPIPDGNNVPLSKLLQKLGDAVAVSELFVYATAFLTPYLYLIFERYYSLMKHGSEVKKNSSLLKVKLFPGYAYVFALAILLILATAMAFGLMKSESPSFNSTFLFHGLNDYALFVYLFSLYCWYLTFLDEQHDPGFYSEELGDSGKSLADALGARLNEKG